MVVYTTVPNSMSAPPDQITAKLATHTSIALHICIMIAEHNQLIFDYLRL